MVPCQTSLTAEQDAFHDFLDVTSYHENRKALQEHTFLALVAHI